MEREGQKVGWLVWWSLRKLKGKISSKRQESVSLESNYLFGVPPFLFLVGL